MNSLISIITPVYNGERYVEAAINSVLSQSYTNWELILVDDGSTDRSGAICDRYEKEYESIHVVHQKNGGVSVARNTALERAGGQYIVFLDADDLLQKDALSVMTRYAESTALVCVQTVPFLDGEEDKICSKIESENVILDQKAAIEALFHEERYGYQGYPGGKMFDKEIIERNHIRFDQNISYNEDRLFITEYMLNASSYRISYESCFYYRQSEDGAMGQSRRNYRSAVLTELDAFEKMREAVSVRYPEIGTHIARLTFEKALYWYGRIPSYLTEDRKKARRIVKKNACRCFKSTEISRVRKAKILLHSILLR